MVRMHHLECLHSSPGNTLDFSFLLLCTLEHSSDGSNDWVPASHVWDLGWVPGFWLLPVPALAGIWDICRHLGEWFSWWALFLSFCLFTFQIHLKNGSHNILKCYLFSHFLLLQRCWLMLRKDFHKKMISNRIRLNREPSFMCFDTIIFDIH